jgi:hypothetical protein
MTIQYNRPWLNRRSAHPLLLVLSAALIGTLTGACNKTPNAQAPPAAATGAPANASATPPRTLRPAIVSVSPAVIEVRGGHAAPTRYAISYTINDPDRVTEAFIIFYAPGLGELQRFPVPVQASGAVELILDPAGVDFGPKVNFRIHCPSGETGWFTLGHAPKPFDHDNSKHEISSVRPFYVSKNGPADTQNEANTGTLVSIWAGDMVTRGCTVETEVEGRNVDLVNVTPMYRQMQGLLMNRDVGYRPIASRYIEVKLSLHAAHSGGAEAIQHIDFDE